MFVFLLVAVATPEMEGNGDWRGELQIYKVVGEEMTLVIGIFPRFSCSFVILFPPPPHSTPYPTENPSLSSPVCVLEIFHILLLLGSEEHKCNSLAHITGSFRPVFCCQM